MLFRCFPIAPEEVVGHPSENIVLSKVSYTYLIYFMYVLMLLRMYMFIFTCTYLPTALTYVDISYITYIAVEVYVYMHLLSHRYSMRRTTSLEEFQA